MNHRVTFKRRHDTIEVEKRKTKQRGDFMNTQKTGEFIKNLRKENNMTQLELAKKLNCTDKAVSRWETGKGLPDADTLLALSDVFSVSINEILLGERYNLSCSDNEYPDMAENAPIIEEIISNVDETIVDILKDKEENIGRTIRSAVMVIVSCCIQVLIFFVIPQHIIMGINPYAEPIVFVIYASLVNFVFAGLIKDKTKWIVPLFTVVCLLSGVVTGDHASVGLAPVFGVACAGVMGIIEFVRYIIKKIKQ